MNHEIFTAAAPKRIPWRYGLIAVILLGLGYVGWRSVSEVRHWQEVRSLVEVMEEVPSAQLVQVIDSQLREVRRRQEWFFSTLFAHRYTVARERLVKAIRRHWLLPALELHDETARESALYLVALLYASRDNALGQVIVRRLPDWQRQLAIAGQTILAYVQHSETPWPTAVSFPFDFPAGAHTGAPLPPIFSGITNQGPWREFLEQAQAAWSKNILLPEEFRRLNEKVAVWQEEIHRWQGAYELAEIICKALPPERVREFPSEKLAQEFRVYHQLDDFLELVSREALEVPAVQTLRQLNDHLQRMQTRLEQIEERRFDFQAADQKFSFAAKTWVQLLQRSKLPLLAERWLNRDPSDLDGVFFAATGHYPETALTTDPASEGLFSNQAKIPGRYTRAAYEREVLPLLQQFSRLWQRLPLAAEEKADLHYGVFAAMAHYAQQYRTCSEAFYQSFAVEAHSLRQLQTILQQMQLPSSPFGEFLRLLWLNTYWEPIKAGQNEENPYLYPMARELSPFQAVNRLWTTGPASPLKSYLQTLHQLQTQLERSEPQGRDSLESALSPLGRLSLAIFQERADSPLNSSKQWLQQVGLRGKWQKPFLEPIYKLYTLGLPEIEQCAGWGWREQVFGLVEPLLAKFPFQRTESTMLWPRELEEVLHPQGKFWRAFAQWLAPLCLEQEGIWRLRPFPGKPPRLAQTILPTVNRLARLSRTFWDGEGRPQPLILHLRPHPLPPSAGETSILLAYLKNGESTSLAFRQEPTWQPFPIHWWEQESAQVGAQFRLPQTSASQDQSLSIPATPWSFFLLLNRASVGEGNRWTWTIPQTSPQLNVTFSSQENPWAWFAVKETD